MLKFKLNKKKKDRKKKGFTLVELLAVIVILAVIMVITIPTVIGSMNKAKEKSEEIFVASIERSIGKFIENELKYSDYNFNIEKNFYNIGSEKNEYGFYNVKDNENKFITLSYLIDKGFISEDNLINPKNSKMCDKDSTLYISYDDINKEYYYNIRLTCANIILNTIPVVNSPDIIEGLIPVIYNENNKIWEVADLSTKWYDYFNQKWANAVAVKNEERNKYKNNDNTFNSGTPINIDDMLAMFVWIPRFSYTIGCLEEDNDASCVGFKIEEGSELDYSNKSNIVPGAIDIKFISVEQKDTLYIENDEFPQYYYEYDNREPKHWYTHPAFTLADKELSGIWVGKFETSKTNNVLTILPNKTSLRKQTIKEQNSTAKQFGSFNTYGVVATSHMMKNSEWSAVAYLSQSIYGKYGNPIYLGKNKEIYNNHSQNYLTGISSGGPSNKKGTTPEYHYDDNTNYGVGLGECGGGASTTGNIYGIYDMNGGLEEYVMANFGKYPSSYKTFFKDNINYFDYFTKNTILSIKDRQAIGQNFYETLKWYNDYNSGTYSYDNLLTSVEPWIIRGGDRNGGDGSSGIFSGRHEVEKYAWAAFRVILLNENL